MRRTLVRVSGAVLLLTAFSQGLFAQAPGGEDAIRKVIDAQVAAWNNHDLNGFMAGYWNSPELTFFSGGTVTHGWQGALERYKKSYQAPGKQMGQLEFQDLQIEMLGPTSAFVRGKFVLTMPDSSHPQGLFTIVFRQFPEGWRIVHDHSSSGN